VRRLAACVLLLGLLLASLAPPAYAQGCVMCRSTAAAADEAGRKTLDLAIFILLIPTVSIFVAVFIWAFRRRNQSWLEPENNSPPDPLPSDLDDAALWRAYRQ
jgi:hypothetical protein